MFSSNTSLQYPFISSSSSSSSSSYVNISPYIIYHQDPNQSISLLHHHLCQNQNQNQNPFPVLPLISPADNNSNNAIKSSAKQVIDGEFLHQYGIADERRPPKKDKHSKIYTAQGLRDRRVRMSIGIARKFFDLQDLLGFDKASKTLDWLLTKSKKDILELSHSNLINSQNLPLNVELQLEQDDMNSKNEKMIKKMKKKTATAESKVKELREKARERARERTRVKMLLTAKYKESTLNFVPTSHSFNQSKSILLNQHHFHQQSSSYLRPCHDQPADQESTSSRESKFIKGKSMMGYQQNFILFKDENFNNNNTPNWHTNSDNNTAIARSTFNSMNRSAGTHLNEKLWD